MKAKTILVITRADNPFVTRTWLKGFVRYARTAKWRVETVRCSGARSEHSRIRALIRYLSPAGIVSSSSENRMGDLFGDIPRAWLDAPAKEISARDSLVSHDGSATAEMAAREFARLGLPRFAVVGEYPGCGWSVARVSAFRKQARRLGGAADVLELEDFASDKVAAMRQIDPWLRRLPKPCGIFAVNDLIASEVIAVANRLELRMPEDVAVVGVDNDVDICELTTPTLTSIATDWEQGGFLVAEALDRAMRNPHAKPVRKTFGELGIIRRASTTVGSARVDPRVAEASAFIRAHACEGIAVDDVVRHMGCSRRLAMMRYLEATGHSIFAEIREAQFAQALVLLSQRDVQLGAIADRCGWKSATALRTYFMKRVGMTPRAWRTQNAAS